MVKAGKLASNSGDEKAVQSAGIGGHAGPVPKEGQAATADGTVIDLAKVSRKINEAIKFMT